MERIFMAGAAREDITPAVGTCLYGYRPNHHSESVHDPLQVTAAAFSQIILNTAALSASLV